MDASQKQYELNEYARTCIHHKARQLVGQAGYTEDDVEDIEQDLTLDLLERLPKFDPAKATFNTFVAQVVARKCCNLVRYRQAEMRDHRREECSLNDEIDDGEGGQVEHVATISQDEHDLRIGKYNRPAEERTDLQLDIAAALDDLPADLRQVAEMLPTMSIAQVARELGIPYSTFYDSHLARLRKAFEKRGLGDYLP